MPNDIPFDFEEDHRIARELIPNGMAWKAWVPYSERPRTSYRIVEADINRAIVEDTDARSIRCSRYARRKRCVCGRVNAWAKGSRYMTCRCGQIFSRSRV